MGAHLAFRCDRAMSEHHLPKNAADEIRDLIERIEGQLRESEALRHQADQRRRRAQVFPERRKRPRVPGISEGDSPSADSM